jgi:hypothetical protein
MGTVAIAIVARKERELVALFRRSGCTSSATAKSAPALGIEEGVALRRLRSRAVIREAASGTFYLDEQSWAALIRLRHRMVLVVLLLAMVFGVIALMARRGQG